MNTIFNFIYRYLWLLLLVGIVLFFIIMSPVEENNKTTQLGSTPTNGDLNKTFIDNEIKDPLTYEQEIQKAKDSLILEGWEEKDIKNGQLPVCYNFNPRKGKVDNFLEVTVGGGTDVAIKVIDLLTNKCVRYVFINSGSTYKIKNIPEGLYYLKIAYGKDWLSKVESKQCVGKFIRNPLYEKGEDIINFNIKNTKDGYSIPSFELKLDVVGTGNYNSFASQDISENEFNQ